MPKVMATKTCSACKSENHIAKKTCACGAKMRAAKAKPYVRKADFVRTMPRKACPACKDECFIAASSCECGYEFRELKPAVERTHAGRGRPPKASPAASPAKVKASK